MNSWPSSYTHVVNDKICSNPKSQHLQDAEALQLRVAMLQLAGGFSANLESTVRYQLQDDEDESDYDFCLDFHPKPTTAERALNLQLEKENRFSSNVPAATNTRHEFHPYHSHRLCRSTSIDTLEANNLSTTLANSWNIAMRSLEEEHVESLAREEVTRESASETMDLGAEEQSVASKKLSEQEAIQLRVALLESVGGYCGILESVAPQEHPKREKANDDDVERKQ